MVEFDHFRASAGKNSFVLPPQQWIEATHAIGMVSKSGRYGGTYAHSDIAFKFAAWLSPAFELYIIKDYQRLKQVESDHLSLDWSARREIAKTNYKIHTDAIKEHLIRSDLPARYVNLTYANEADVINVALFGMTAKEWRDRNPRAKGNIRDAANLAQLIILSNLENLNAEYIKAGLSQLFPPAARDPSQSGNRNGVCMIDVRTQEQMKAFIDTITLRRGQDFDANIVTCAAPFKRHL